METMAVFTQRLRNTAATKTLAYAAIKRGVMCDGAARRLTYASKQWNNTAITIIHRPR